MFVIRYKGFSFIDDKIVRRNYRSKTGVTNMQIEGFNINVEPKNWLNAAVQAAASVNAVPKNENTDNTVAGVAKTSESNAAKKYSDNSKDNDIKDESSKKLDSTNLKFQIHKETGAVIIKIIDSDTGEVIREIPPEAILDSIAQIWKNSGINVDKKV